MWFAYVSFQKYYWLTWNNIYKIGKINIHFSIISKIKRWSTDILKNIIIKENKILIIRRRDERKTYCNKIFRSKVSWETNLHKIHRASSPMSTSLKTFLLISLQFSERSNISFSLFLSLSLYQSLFSHHFLSFSITLTVSPRETLRGRISFQRRRETSFTRPWFVIAFPRNQRHHGARVIIAKDFHAGP